MWCFPIFFLCVSSFQKNLQSTVSSSRTHFLKLEWLHIQTYVARVFVGSWWSAEHLQEVCILVLKWHLKVPGAASQPWRNLHHQYLMTSCFTLEHKVWRDPRKWYLPFVGCNRWVVQGTFNLKKKKKKREGWIVFKSKEGRYIRNKTMNDQKKAIRVVKGPPSLSFI